MQFFHLQELLDIHITHTTYTINNDSSEKNCKQMNGRKKVYWVLFFAFTPRVTNILISISINVKR